ncbi:MAG TPA: xanthine dehydrogenase family protein molybdopterin-binding subunit [archaeon]|nr:xanthine dehydrogenase family protein molybdopterin-binding subunit [archaeon]
MAKWKPFDQMKYVGRAIPRTDGPAKVSGSAKFTQDIILPGMLYGKILRSPHAHAYLKNIDTSRAEAHSEVKAVILLDKYTVRYFGEEIAAVAATSPDAAEEALDLIRVVYQQLPYVVTEEDAMAPDAPRIHEEGNVSSSARGDKGKVEELLKASAHVAEDTIRTQVQVHNTFETHSVVCHWEDGKLKVWISTQGVHGARDDFAKLFELDQDKVEAICEYMGGGFGSKFPIGVEGIVAGRLARMTGKPVKVMLSRKEEYLAMGNRPSSIQKFKLGCDKSGKLSAFWLESYGTGGISEDSGFPSPYIYKVPNGAIYRKHSDVRINAGAARPQRAPGHPQSQFGMEIIMDELAEKAGMDPLEFRMINDPDEKRQRQYKIGAERIGWSERRNKVPGSSAGPVKRGIGVGSGTWGGGGAKSTKVQIDIYPDGKVKVATGTQDLGTGIRTLVHQTAAEALGVPMEYITPDIGRSTLPFSTASGGSITTGSVVPAVKNTGDTALARMLETAAPALGVSADELVCEDGVIHSTRDRTKSIKWKDAAALLGSKVLSVTEGWVEGLSSSGVAGCQFIEVEVDMETGRIKPVKVVAVQDFGLVVNMLTARSQIAGGITMGLSWALAEDRTMDPNTGNMVNPNMENYKLAGSLEIPEIDVVIDNMPERGVIGLGEPPRIPTAGALANAVYNAIGARVCRIPMTPDVVLEALANKGGA